MFDTLSMFWKVVIYIIYVIVSFALSMLASWTLLKIDNTGKGGCSNIDNDIKEEVEKTSGLLETTIVDVSTNKENISSLKNENKTNNDNIILIQKNLSTVQTQSNSNERDISSLKTSVDSLQTQTNSNEQDISSLKTSVESLQSQTNPNESDISSLRTSVDSNTSDISSLKTSVKANTTAITSLRSQANSNTETISLVSNTLSGKISDINDSVFFSSTFTLDIGQLNRMDMTTYSNKISSTDDEGYEICNEIKKDTTRLENTSINVIFCSPTTVSSVGVNHSDEGIILYTNNSVNIHYYYSTYVDLNHFIKILGGYFDPDSIKNDTYKEISILSVDISVHDTKISLLVLCYSPPSASIIPAIPSSYYSSINQMISNMYNKNYNRRLLLHVTNIPTTDTEFFKNITYMNEPVPLSVQGDIVSSKVDYDVPSYLKVTKNDNAQYGFSIVKQEGYKYSKVYLPTGVK